MAIIYLTRFPECPAPSCRVRLLPEGFFPLSRKKRAGNSSLCFVLHHMGFFLRSRLREDPVGSYPAFSPLPSISSVSASVSSQLNFICGSREERAPDSHFCELTLALTLTTTDAGRYILCDTFRYQGFTSRVPSFSRGMPPSGVRTFL
jgi:hypothetical protein